MLYKKISVEVIVVADEAEGVVAELNAALDRLEESHTLFGGDIEIVAFEHGKNKKAIGSRAHDRRRCDGQLGLSDAREDDRLPSAQSSEVGLPAS